MFTFINNKQKFQSKLFDEKSFYTQFLKDLSKCRKEVIIESPFITTSRIDQLYPVFEDLVARKVFVCIITRYPTDYDDEYMRHQATNEILRCADLGINTILLKGCHHRKLAILDRNILWEGSLIILSFSNSLEIMRRIEDKGWAGEIIKFLRLERITSISGLTEG